jgi:hypothetical protein
MSNHDRTNRSLGVPADTPKDLPMPPYRFQREGGVTSVPTDGNGTAKQAADILRQANLLGCSAASSPRH